MSILTRLIAILGVLLAAVGVSPAAFALSAQPVDTVFDIADVPVPVQELAEDGYQVMTGGYLELETAADKIADPRERSTSSVSAELMDAGWLQSYMQDHVLLEDRAYADSAILALVETNVFLFADDEGASRVYELMTDFANRGGAESVESSASDTVTVRLQSESGDTMRSVSVRDRVVVEVVSLEGFGFVEQPVHDTTVVETINRLEALQTGGGVGLMPRAVRLTDGEKLAEVVSLEQSGVHQVYRIRDGVTQPAAGEVSAPSPDQIADGVSELYHSSEAIRFDNGVGFMSTWIAGFDSDESAAGFYDEVVTGSPADYLTDPYFPIALEEQALPQGIEGVYRVTGIYDGQPYSGTLEVRQHGRYVVAVGSRMIGSVLPPVDMASRIMDRQLGCLDDEAACAPIDLGELLTPPMATPVVPASAEGLITSEEFGWSVHLDSGTWEITEEFSESGYDFVELQSGRSLVTLESVINQHGDPQQCILDEMNMLQELESSAVIDLGSDDGNEAPAGSEARHAWAIYTVEPLADERADQEYVVRFDCYTLIDGGANLVMSHRAPRGEWADERVRGDEIRNGLSLTSMRAPVDIWLLKAS